MSRPPALLTCLTAAALSLTACGGSTAASAGGQGGAGGLEVVAAFYPLQFVTERVAGDRASVTSLTAPGAEPHDLELSPRAVAGLTEADLVVFQGGFQTAVDDALASEGGDNALDVAPDAGLDLVLTDDPHEGEEHAEGEEADGTDPHSWLDPVRLAGVVEAVGARLSELDPEGEQTYTANAERLTADLTALDGEFERALAGCSDRTLVTSHEAFGYLAQRYGFEQLGISGLSPEAEPEAARLAEITDFVRANGVSTIYFETLVDPAVAQTVATETGAATAVLDPIEGLTDESAGDDYLEVQRANLESLRIGQSCP